jgi:hypothetical protein
MSCPNEAITKTGNNTSIRKSLRIGMNKLNEAKEVKSKERM